MICGEYFGNDSVFTSLKGETVSAEEGVGASVQVCIIVSQGGLVVVGLVAEIEHDLTIESVTVQVQQNNVELERHLWGGIQPSKLWSYFDRC